MPDTIVTLEYSGMEKKLGDWGISQASLNLVNMRPDTFRCSIPVDTINDAPLFPFEGIVKVRSGRSTAFAGGHVDFVGYRLDPVHDGRPQYEGVHYEFANAWYLMENTPFQQPAAAYLIAGVGFQFNSGLVLFTKISEGHAADPYETDDGHLAGFLISINSGHQIREILKHALAMFATQGMAAPFQVGTVEPALNLPMYQCQEVTCAAAIQKCLELSPDATTSWDYSTTPPTINVVTSGAPVTLAIADGVEHKSIHISPKPTLQPSVVIIYFRITGSFTVDGEEHTYVQYARQKWGPAFVGDIVGAANAGPEGGLRALIQTIDLAGFSSATVTQKIEALPFTPGDALFSAGGQPAIREFWSNLKPYLKGYDYRRVSFQDTTIYDASTNAILGYQSSIATFVALWPKFLTKGALSPWMTLAGGDPVVGRKVKITAKMFRKIFSSAGSGAEADEGGFVCNDNTQNEATPPYDGAENISAEVTATNGLTGLYSEVASETQGESIPEGLAEAVWNSIAALQYEGDHVKVQAESISTLTLANSLNLSGGAAEWAAMNAIIQSITKDYGSGETSVSFGPAKHINSGDLNALFQFNRMRRVWQNPSVRETGQP